LLREKSARAQEKRREKVRLHLEVENFKAVWAKFLIYDKPLQMILVENVIGRGILLNTRGRKQPKVKVEPTDGKTRVAPQGAEGERRQDQEYHDERKSSRRCVEDADR